MKVAKIISDQIEIHNLYNLYPNVSFPDVGVPDDFLTDNSLYKVIDTIECDHRTQYISQLNPPILKDGVVYTIELKNKTQEEIVNNKWNEIRDVRNQLLANSDKYLLLDLWETYSDDLKTKIKQYRQSLRDIPQTIVDPYNISWPTNPNK